MEAATVTLRDEDNSRVFGAPEASLWGNDDPRIAALRERYLEAGPWRGKGYLTAKQRDILGVLRVADDPLSLKTLYYVFDAIPRTWAGHDAAGIGNALKQCATKGLAEKVSLRATRRGAKLTDALYGWRLLPEARRAEPMRRFDGDAPVKLVGIGPKTGRVYRRRRRQTWQRAARACAACGRQFRTLDDTPHCSVECARAMADERLRALIEEQSREARWGDSLPKRDWLVSLNERVRSKSESGHLMMERIEFLESAAARPEEAVLGGEADDERRAVLGALDERDVTRVSDATIEHLQDRLRELGLVPRGVQRKERERLRTPARHRGGAPPPVRGHMHTAHKHRKPGHRSAAGGQRPARKPRRWRDRLPRDGYGAYAEPEALS